MARKQSINSRVLQIGHGGRGLPPLHPIARTESLQIVCEKSIRTQFVDIAGKLQKKLKEHEHKHKGELREPGLCSDGDND